ncbi:MAG: DnaJ domain-containing protein [Acidobacteria bacterium]|nr:DnaJ domain-containing protein [Acidobacteriota bacterium]
MINYYEVLGVERDASDDEIRSAFRKLIYKYHPDRFPPDKRAKAEERFQSITEAFNVLSRPASREAYDRELSLGTKREVKHDPREIARRLSVKGAQAFKDGSLLEAKELLELAINHDGDNARAQYFLGMTLLQMKGREKSALRHLERAIQLESDNLAMKVEAARAFFKAGMSLRASRLANEVLLVDPTNARALAIISRLESDDTTKGASDGLLGRLKRRT